VTHYPRPIAEGVSFCGFASPKSYGARSYLIERPGGNWMTDAPRFEPELADEIEKRGGLSRIFLTHRDDVADADLYAQRFGAKCLIHEDDLDAAPFAEIVLRGSGPSWPEDDLTVIPVPGHTRGHCVLLYKNKFLFTGDHLDYDLALERLAAFRDFCWYDWAEQTRSMERLKDYRFEWILPGHGGEVQLPPEKMQAELAALIERMKADPPVSG
jgi:glyoxylase-like metal-dependent hydrolase (beta-lactamase superfamily II)